MGHVGEKNMFWQWLNFQISSRRVVEENILETVENIWAQKGHSDLDDDVFLGCYHAIYSLVKVLQ